MKDKEPLVCVVIPVYNGEKFIGEAIDSIMNQTYSNWECHVINNVSKDRTAEIVQEYSKKDSRVILHNPADFFPLVDNWNRTVQYVPENAVYYKMVQADDWIYPNCLEEMVSIMEKHPTAGMCSSYRIDGKTVNCDGLDYYEGQFYLGNKLLIRHLLQDIDITGSVTTLLFRISYLKQLPQFPNLFDSNDLHCDTQLAFDVMNISDVTFVFRVLSYTRWHPEAFTVNTAVICNTFFHGRETRLFKFKHLHPDVMKEYRNYRYSYAYFILKKWLRHETKCLNWHKERLKRKFTLSEYLLAIWLLNPINYRIISLLKRTGIISK